jgi:single-stranded-DNA-specific exonuclease
VLQKRWDIASRIPSDADSALSALNPILRQLLYNRGLETEAAARHFLSAEVDFDTNPLQLHGMPKAVERIRLAIAHRQTIAVYGDYDVDGVTATALLVEALKWLGATVKPYIPHRFEEGYGLNPEALDNLKADGASLVITVDCGIRSLEEARHAAAIGLDLIVTDHHHPLGEELPAALSVICPKQAGDIYPEKNLAGVGLAYKLAQALADHGESGVRDDRLLDLVALGTVADLAPLTGENRMLVRRGLNELRQTTRQGLFSLAAVAELALPRVSASHIGFILGPRLNAAGRLDSAVAALELLTTTDSMKAGQLAQQLEVQNRQRQALTRETQERAEALVLAEETEPMLLFAADKSFNAGVVGLAASRLSDTYYRPAVVAAKGSEETRGSCRSIPEFHITDALDQCADLLVRHGGHAAAAGFTVRNEKLDELKHRLKSIAAQQLGDRDLRPTLSADMEVKLSDLSFDLLRDLSPFEPTGYGNREPIFVSRRARARSWRTVGADGRHLKLKLEDEGGATLDAIGFRLGQEHPRALPYVDIAYTLEVNEYGGRTTLQLNVKDLRES